MKEEQARNHTATRWVENEWLRKQAKKVECHSNTRISTSKSKSYAEKKVTGRKEHLSLKWKV